MPAEITLLAGVNGAGKSSIGGAMVLDKGATWFNPDAEARRIMERYGCRLEEANKLAWQRGEAILEHCLFSPADNVFAMETTLGGDSIVRLLIDGATSQKAKIDVWYCGLTSPELHIQRIASRVASGGHHIPEAKVRSRWETSRANLVRLVPHLRRLAVYDNSAEDAEPRLLINFSGDAVAISDHIPDWALPIADAARARFEAA